jgi:hypothetical protein
MPYKPTGKPPGRPKKPQADPPAADDGQALTTAQAPAQRVLGPFPPLPGREHAEHKATGELCLPCYPDGWPDMVTGLGCPHGTWTRRLF